MSELEKIKYPDILFKIENSLYCINSRYVLSISKLPKYKQMPGAAEGVSGIIKFRDEVVPVIDLRVLFGIHTLQEEYEEFVQMLETRKNDHIHWVEELEKSVNTGDEFTLVTDPHKCAFGKWYYNFHTDSHAVDFHMKKVEEPHRRLHEAAKNVNEFFEEHDECVNNTCVKDIFKEVEQEFMPQVVGILEEAKTIFKASYTEMAIIIKHGDTRLGLIVDEVLSIEMLEEVDSAENALKFQQSKYINMTKQRKETEELVLEVDDTQILYRFSNAVNEIERN